MKKGLWFGIIAVLCLFVTTVFFPYSFFSVYRSISIHTELPILQDYKMKLYEFRKEYEEKKERDRKEFYTFDNVQYSTEFILDTYEMDIMTTSRSSISKRDLNEMLGRVRSLRNSLLHITFDEEHSSESKKYLFAALRWCLETEENIDWIKSKPFSTRSQLSTHLEDLQSDFRQSFEMYLRFYDAFYNYEEEIE